ncbi:Uncharacterized protein Adt_12962 [Abeliophyllum distichum]|uniref:Uncharacterized protein n=1 Tax=Abeliophyllum distichum TaxID=126358 RepID=A0ABD1TVF7_9LAMI
MYNKRLKDRHVRLKSLKEGEDPLIANDFPSDDEWIADVDSEIPSNTRDLNDDQIQPSAQGIGSSTHTQSQYKRKRAVSQKDKGKGKLKLVDEEEDWIDIASEDEEDDMRIRYDDDSMEDPTNSDDDNLSTDF